MSQSGTSAGLEDRLASISRAHTAAVEGALDRTATFLEERVDANIPRRTGALAGTLHRVRSSTAYRKIVDLVCGGPQAPYALGVEYRQAAEDQAHRGEATPEGFPGAGFFRRVVDMHRALLKENTIADVRAAR